ncbi:hypothetical protein SynBIOSE41_00140 [Synechococcus sp. BIOS-E4-1]|nr:hypothetical protein SynBIOSE41_00140 [Synechococcus sp. BIOS-E4-1]
MIAERFVDFCWEFESKIISRMTFSASEFVFGLSQLLSTLSVAPSACEGFFLLLTNA